MQNIREAREAKGMTQEQVAKMVGVTQGAVAQWENGLTHPSFDKLVRIADVLEVPLDELVRKKAG